MKVFPTVSLFLIILSIPLQCAAGPQLSKDEAKEIISAHFTYPLAVSTQITFQEKGAEMLAYLKKRGYIVEMAAQTCCGDFYATTEKGKPHFGEFVKYFSDNKLRIDCVYAKKIMKSIETIRVDSEKRLATVDYIEGLEPNGPVYSEVFRKSLEGGGGINFDETKKIKVRLRYSGKGWKVEH